MIKKDKKLRVMRSGFSLFPLIGHETDLFITNGNFTDIISAMSSRENQNCLFDFSP